MWVTQHEGHNRVRVIGMSQPALVTPPSTTSSFGSPTFMNTPTAEFIYGSQRAFESEDDLTEYLDTPGRDETVPRVQRRTSPYISVFEGSFYPNITVVLTHFF